MTLKTTMVCDRCGAEAAADPKHPPGWGEVCVAARRAENDVADEVRNVDRSAVHLCPSCLGPVRSAIAPKPWRVVPSPKSSAKRKKRR